MRVRTCAAVTAALVLLGGAPVSYAAPVGMLSDSVDSDGDALPDSWEQYGLDVDGDGNPEVDLPGLGADPRHKDIFVEMDYMPGREPSDAVLARIAEVFGTSPVPNPDGSTGIAIHLDLGTRGAAVPPAQQDPGTGSATGSTGSAGSAQPQRPKAGAGRYDLGGGNPVPDDPDLNPSLTEVGQLRQRYFAPERAYVFHYMVWGDRIDGSCSSGQGFAIPNDTFVVALGPACFPEVAEDQQVGTFIHELGHNLGLQHGGTDGVNYKPNYLSVMNYSFQMFGVPRSDGTWYFGYSDADPGPLDENRLDEQRGLGPLGAGWRTAYSCGFAATPNRYTDRSADQPIDWNCDGEHGLAASSINSDWLLNNLTAQNNWASLQFNGGDIGSTSKYTGTPLPAPVELDSVTANELARSLHRH
ncbi:hypothetical protein JK358_36210 [Nocardia sp. 2]|uniref:Uncharacterized protein n=1 Tax=Nocardia acididurans TaxID=2802282 RepID=A0ABS1MGR1_9NOCA|nr:hypothetical protein [Nocardia acididurans]MBL1079858.1 hypothetical protein [Nocardia acididurans]